MRRLKLDVHVVDLASSEHKRFPSGTPFKNLALSIKRRKYPFKVLLFSGNDLIYVAECDGEKGVFREPTPPGYYTMTYPPVLKLIEFSTKDQLLEILAEYVL